MGGKNEKGEGSQDTNTYRKAKGRYSRGQSDQDKDIQGKDAPRLARDTFMLSGKSRLSAAEFERV